MYHPLDILPGIGGGFLGPEFREGPLPAAIYLATSAKESLTSPLFNQPALPLLERPMRVFSFDLPAHGEGFVSKEAIGHWAEAFSQGKNLLTPALEKMAAAISVLIEEKVIDPKKMGLMGLSRGGWFAAHLATLFPRMHALVGFAPLTHLGALGSFANISYPPSLDLIHLGEPLAGKKIRFTIGNRDLRVSTQACINCTLAWVEAAFAKGHRSPPIELLLTPSIGHLGHGTSLDAFQSGAQWLLQMLDLHATS